MLTITYPKHDANYCSPSENDSVQRVKAGMKGIGIGLWTHPILLRITFRCPLELGCLRFSFFFGFTSIWLQLLMESDAKIDAKSTPNRRQIENREHPTLRFRWRCLFQKPPISIRVIVVSPLINLGSIEVDYDRKSYDDHTPYFICNWSTSFDFLLSYLMEFFLLYTTLHEHTKFKKMMFQHKVVTSVNYLSSKR